LEAEDLVVTDLVVVVAVADWGTKTTLPLSQEILTQFLLEQVVQQNTTLVLDEVILGAQVIL
jgi:hypothetical protein